MRRIRKELLIDALGKAVKILSSYENMNQEQQKEFQYINEIYQRTIPKIKTPKVKKLRVKKVLKPRPVKIRNDTIIKYINLFGYKSVNDFCVKNKFSPTVIGEIINFKRSPLNNITCDYSDVAKQLALVLCYEPNELWPDSKRAYSIYKNKQSMVESAEENFSKVSMDNECVDPYELFSKKETREKVWKAISSLEPREKEIIQLRFGIGRKSDHVLEDIASHFGLSRERIRQLEAKALRHLRQESKSLGLKLLY